MGYSFRFYGRAPADWHEGANLGHGYEVQFARALDDAGRARLAALWERTMASGAAEPSPEPWLWSDGRFALFHVGERFPSAARMVFSRVTDFLMAARDVCPIRDVVYLNAAAPGTSRWDRWTVETQPEPDPGPRYPMELDDRVLFHRRDRSGGLPVGAEDVSFEEARREARSQLVREKAAVAGEQGGLSLEPVDGRPRAPQWPAEVCDASELWALSDMRPVGARACAYTRDSGGVVKGFAYLDDGGQRRTVTIDAQGYPGSSFAVHPDGTRALCAVRNIVHEVDFATGVAAPRWTPDWQEGEIQGLDYLAGGELWAVKNEKMLYVVDPEGDEPAPVASARSKGNYLGVGRHGTILYASEWGKKPQIFGFAEGKLKKIATFKLKLHFEETDGVIYLFCGDDTFRLANVDETYEAFAAKLRAKAEKARLAALGRSPAGKAKKATRKKAAASKVPKPQLVIRWGDVDYPADVERSHERTAATAVHGPTGATAVYGFVKFADEPWLGYERIRWTRDGGELAVDLARGRGVTFSPDGGYLLAATENGVFRVMEDGATQLVLATGKGEFFRDVLFLAGRLLALLNKRLYLLAPDADGDAVIVHKVGATHGFQVLPIPGHDAVTVAREDRGLDVVRLVGDKLKKLGKVDDHLREVVWQEGTLHVWDLLGRRAGVVENVLELLQA